MCKLIAFYWRDISATIKNLVASTSQWGSLHLAYKNIIYVSAKIKDLSLFLLTQLRGYQAKSTQHYEAIW